ncbi:MAG: hypothetical protein WCI43_02680 [Candidatus Firestonebacteria bacterium]
MKKYLLFSLLVVCSVSCFAAENLIDPPVRFAGTPLRTALDLLFLKAKGVPYVIDTRSEKLNAPVFVKMNRPSSVEDLLTLLLAPNGLIFSKSQEGIYHIDEGEFTFDKKIIKKLRRKTPPEEIEAFFDFNNAPLLLAIEKICEPAGVSYVVSGGNSSAGNYPVNFRYMPGKKIKVETLLGIILKPAGLVCRRFEYGIEGVYNIRAKAENEAWEEVKESVLHTTLRDVLLAGPVKLSGIQLLNGLERLFLKAGQKFESDVKEIGSYGGMFYNSEKDVLLSAALKDILEPLGLATYYNTHKDSVHICRAGVRRAEISYQDIYESGSLDFLAMLERVRAALSKDGKLSFDDEEEVLIVADKPENIEKAESAIKK